MAVVVVVAVVVTDGASVVFGQAGFKQSHSSWISITVTLLCLQFLYLCFFPPLQDLSQLLHSPHWPQLESFVAGVVATV